MNGITDKLEKAVASLLDFCSPAMITILSLKVKASQLEATMRESSAPEHNICQLQTRVACD